MQQTQKEEGGGNSGYILGNKAGQMEAVSVLFHGSGYSSAGVMNNINCEG